MELMEFAGRMASRCALVSVAAACMACDGPTMCGDPPLRIVPLDTTISPGQSFTARWETGVPCRGGWEAISTHWATTDTDVVRLDTLSGLVTGRATGDAAVKARHHMMVMSGSCMC